MSAITVNGADELTPKQARRFEAPTLKQPRRYIGWKVQLLPYQLFFGHLGKFTVIALYFIATQLLHGQHTTVFNQGITFPDVKYFWDHLLTQPIANGGLVHVMSQHEWDPWRHLVRAVYEGIFGALLFGQVGFNALAYTKAKVKDKPGRYDQFVLDHLNGFVASKYQTHPVTAAQLVAWPLVITLASILFVALGFGIDYGIHHLAHSPLLSDHLNRHPGIAAKIYSDSFDAVLVGLFAGFSPLVKAVTYPVFYTNSMYFARRRLAREKHAHIYHPITYRRLVQWLDLRSDSREQAEEALAARGKYVRHIIVWGTLFLIALSIFGYEVIQKNGHF